MLGRLSWILPAAFVTIAIVYAVAGYAAISALFVAIALGLSIHAMGVRRQVAPLQWFGAVVSAFAVMVLLWRAFGRP